MIATMDEQDERGGAARLVDSVPRVCKHLFHDCPGFEPSADVLDRAQQLEQEEIWLAAAERSAAEAQQRQTVQALRREGRYGVCLECDAPIAPRRLEAYPSAVRCLSCQAKYEECEQCDRRGTSGSCAALFSSAATGDSE